MESKIYDMLIVGGGPGGYTAALYAARGGLSVLVLEKLSAGGQMAQTFQIDNYPGFSQGVDGYELAMQMEQQAHRFGAQTEYTEVQSLDLTAQPKAAHTSDGTYFGKTVVLATGAGPRVLGLPGEQELLGRGVAYCAACDGMFYKGKTVVVVGGGNTAAADALLLSRVLPGEQELLGRGVAYCAACDGMFYKGKTVVVVGGGNTAAADALLLSRVAKKVQELLGRGVAYCAACDGMFYKGKTVVVVGGGNTAAADALLLSRVAKKVYLVHRRDTLRATKIYHNALETAENLELVWNSTVTALEHEDRLTAVELTNLKTGETKRIACDGLFVSVGRTPATELVRGQLELNQHGYVVAGESTKTSIPGVFAVGDVRTKQVRQVVTAVSDGAVAAHMAEEFLAGGNS